MDSKILNHQGTKVQLIVLSPTLSYEHALPEGVDASIHVIDPVAGVSATKARLLSQSRHEFVGFIESNDRISASFGLMLAAIEKDVVGVYTNSWVTTNSSLHTNKAQWSPLRQLTVPQDMLGFKLWRTATAAPFVKDALLYDNLFDIHLAALVTTYGRWAFVQRAIHLPTELPAVPTENIKELTALLQPVLLPVQPRSTFQNILNTNTGCSVCNKARQAIKRMVGK